MAKLYGEIAAKSLLTLDKSFARANGQPLDASEVYYSLDAAKAYAATAQAYIGQKIVVIENGIVTHYSVEDTAGNLKELGAKPVADGTTIAIDENGKITLANITETEATGTYNAVLVNGKLTWVKPSSTTVEGLNDLIVALTKRVDDAEADINALETSLGVAAKPAKGEEGSEDYEPAVEATGLHKTVADEIARATAAEKDLSDRIDAIDFINETELNTALEPYAKSADVVSNETYTIDKEAFESEDAAVRAIAEEARDTINTFLNSEEIDTTVNTLKEIQAEIEKMTDATELAAALSTKADLSYVNEELAEKQDVIPENTYDAYGAAATAKEEAISAAAGDATSKANQALADAKADAANLYATKVYVGSFTTGEDEYKDLDTVVAYINKKAEETLKAAQGGSSETAASVALALQNYKNENDPKVKANTDNIATINEKLKDIENNADVNIIETVKVNNVALVPDENKAVNITVPTKFSDITDDSGFDSRITAAQTQADKGVSDAAAAQTKANEAAAAAATNATAIGELNTTVSGHTTTINDHASRVKALEDADAAHASEYQALSGIVSGHTEAIAKKAEQTALDAVSAKASANEASIKTLNETTIPGINTEIGKKANTADVYNKTEIGTIAEGKTLVQMIADAKSEATYDDTAVKASIKANTDAITLLNGSAETAGSVAHTAAAAAKAEVATVIGAAPEAMDTLEEVAKWIENDESGAAAMANRITANETAISNINNADSGILAQAKAYTNSEIAGLPAATASVLGLVKFDDTTIKMNENNQLYVAKVSTDILEQGTEVLILNGGTASN